MEGQELTAAFDFAFGTMKEYLDVLRTLMLKGKAFHVFSFQKWSSQLQLIQGCYSGRKGVVSEFLKVGAPDEISSLFTFKTVGVLHHPRVSSWPLRALLEARALGVAAVQKKEIFWNVGDFSESGNVITCCRFIIPSFLVRSLDCFLCEES